MPKLTPFGQNRSEASLERPMPSGVNLVGRLKIGVQDEGFFGKGIIIQLVSLCILMCGQFFRMAEIEAGLPKLPRLICFGIGAVLFIISWFFPRGKEPTIVLQYEAIDGQKYTLNPPENVESAPQTVYVDHYRPEIRASTGALLLVFRNSISNHFNREVWSVPGLTDDEVVSFIRSHLGKFGWPEYEGENKRARSKTWLSRKKSEGG